MTARHSGLAVAGVAAATAAVVGVAWAVPAARPTDHAVDVTAPLTRVCPVVDPTFAPSRVLVANQQGVVKARELSGTDAAATVSPGSVGVFEHSRSGIQTELAAGARGGASTLSAQADGLERGLAGSSCTAPANVAWFPVVQQDQSAQTTLYLSSIDDTSAVVDVSFFGPAGRIDAPSMRSITVKPHSTRAVSLDGILTVQGVLSAQVTTSSGRVAALARVRHMPADPAATSGNGVDWEATATAPAATSVIPGVPAGDGDRTLVVYNASDRVASYTYDVLTADGRQTSDPLTVAAGANAVVPIDGLLKGRAASVVVRSSQAVTAAVQSVAGQGDFTLSTAAPALTSVAVVPVPQGDGKATLQVSAVTDADVRVQSADLNGTALGAATTQHIAAGTTWTLSLPAGAVVTPTLTVLAGGVYGSVILTQDQKGFAGITQFPLVRAEGGRSGVDPVADQRLS